MNSHAVIAALGVGVGIVAAFVVWTFISPTLTKVTG